MTKKENVKINALVSGIYYNSKYDSVGLAIEIDDGEKIYYNYLLPFRRYRLQVCGTISGEWDLGSTKVFGFRNLIQTMIKGAWFMKDISPSNIRWDNLEPLYMVFASLCNEAILDRSQYGGEFTSMKIYNQSCGYGSSAVEEYAKMVVISELIKEGLDGLVNSEDLEKFYRLKKLRDIQSIGAIDKLMDKEPDWLIHEISMDKLEEKCS